MPKPSQAGCEPASATELLPPVGGAAGAAAAAAEVAAVTIMLLGIPMSGFLAEVPSFGQALPDLP